MNQVPIVWRDVDYNYLKSRLTRNMTPEDYYSFRDHIYSDFSYMHVNDIGCMDFAGGYPGNYDPSIKGSILVRPPKLFISGHSHILKVKYDKTLDVLHINPGAAGIQGFHKVRTMVRFAVDGGTFKDLEVIELADR
jgi:hypothetical protein